MFNFKLVVLALTVALIGTSSAAPASAPQDEAVMLSRGTEGFGSVTPSVATGNAGLSIGKRVPRDLRPPYGDAFSIPLEAP